VRSMSAIRALEVLSGTASSATLMCFSRSNVAPIVMHIGVSTTKKFLVAEGDHIGPTVHSCIQTEAGLECSQ